MRPPIPTIRLRTRAVIVACAVAVALSACGGGVPAQEVAAQVGETAITNTMVARTAPTYKALSGQCQEDADCNRQVLALLIEAATVRAWAQEHEQMPSATEVNQLVDQISTQAGGEEKVREALASGGGELGSLQNLARAIVAVGKVRVAMGEEATDEQLRTTYDATKNNLLATLDTAHILVDDEALAERIASQATTGNFAQLAKEHSLDTASAEQGGALGPMEGGQLVPPYAIAAGAATPGEIIGPVKTQFGYHIIWVKSVQVPSFETVQEKVRGFVYDVWITAKLRSGAVRVNPRYGRLDPDTRTIVPITSTAVDPATEQQSNIP